MEVIMDINKQVFMQAAIVIDQITREYLDFIATKRQFVAERLINASAIDDDTYEAISSAVDRTLSIMRHVEEMGTGDSTGHKVRQKRLAEVKSIMHIARSHPQSALKRLDGLPKKKLVNA
jgi:hypothetical protein